MKWFCAWGRVTPAFIFLLFARQAQANPTGLTVVSGSASAQTSGSQLNISTSQNAVLNWQSFNIAAGEKTIFNQPSATSIVFNNIGGQSASQIYGSLQANGIVVLLNSSGFYFGPNSFVSTAGLVVSTANCLPPQNFSGAWQFNGPPPLASIVNYGRIKIGNGGDCFLIANQIENHGTVEADGGGSVQFAAGQSVTLSERPDGRGMSMAVTLPQGSVDNYGNVIADGGTIAMNAKVVNQDGLLQADSVCDENGVIELVASSALNLGANSQLLARGDSSTGGSAGGNVALRSENNFNDSVGSQITTSGGANGGNGGNVEVSAPNVNSLNTAMDASAQVGSVGGSLLLDPDNIVLGFSGSFTIPNSGTVADNSGSGTLNINVNTAFLNKNFSSIKLQANDNISLADGTLWNLAASTGLNAGQLTLQAGWNISIGNGAKVLDANAWSVTLAAGYNFANNQVNDGLADTTKGNIVFNGSGALQLGSGLVNLIAANNITVNSGYIITTGGGSILAHALAGTIDAGTDAQGYTFASSATTLANSYNLSGGLGGISTAAGGDVTLIAGGDVNSLEPSTDGNNKGYNYLGNFVSVGKNIGGNVATAGAGAFGSQAGNVTVIAGGNVTGHYNVANGTGKIIAGVKMDANGNPQRDGSGNYALGSTGNAGKDLKKSSLSLSVISGGWSVTAANNIFLEEVNNPNGVYDTSGAFKHYFDYAPSDYVDLTAGNGVQLGGNSSTILRLDTPTVPVIYPGILDISAGAGGVTFNGDNTFSKLILFPSPQGSLVIDTTSSGSLTGVMPANQGQPQIFQLIMSDSSATQFRSASTFGSSDHATTPIHLGSEEPVELNISGNMSLFSLIVPEVATVNVGGNLVNCRFQGMNLSSADTTTINVAGNIFDAGEFTTINISGLGDPDLSVLARAFGNSLSAATLENTLFYDSSTHLLTYHNIPGQTLASVLSVLENLTVQQVDASGNLLWKDSLHTDPLTETVSVINPDIEAALKAAYQLVPTNLTGLYLGGGGTFLIKADNIDLGTTAGIRSYGAGFYNVAGYYPLAQLFDTGADIVVNAAGNISLPSSSISSLNGGDIYINADGNISVGSSAFTVYTSGARGIFSTGLGNVSVYAGGDINIQGSRIADYDTRPLATGVPAPSGGLTIVSRNGDITVGDGGSGFCFVSSYFVNPANGAVTADSSQIPGTGILQTSYNRNGNVLVEALNGNITIGAGGIEQVLYKGNQTSVDWDQLATLMRLALEGNDAAAKNYQKEINGLITSVAAPIIDVYAGYGLQTLDAAGHPVLDAYGNPIISADNLNAGTLLENSPGLSIDATGSGIVGAGTANLKASGSITGNIISFGDVNLEAVNNISVNVFGLGIVNVDSANGSVTGTIIGVGGINASGSSIDANLESNDAISGGTSGGEGFAVSQAAGNVAAGTGNEASASAQKGETVAATDDDQTKRKKGIALAQKVSRVTVLLPGKD